MKKITFDVFALFVLEFVWGIAIGITTGFWVLGQLDWASGAFGYGLFIPLALFTLMAINDICKNNEES